jgi:Zn-dependent M28 family amino/carboxypeptidase
VRPQGEQQVGSLRRRFGVLLCAFIVTPVFAAGQFDGHSWWTIVTALADDANEGRDTGSAGEQRAQAYIVEHLQQLGVSPAGVSGYYQPVPLRVRTLDESDSSLTLIGGAQPRTLTFGREAMLAQGAPLAPSVEAGLVFVGYGIDIPDRHYSDLADVDLHGKVAVYIAGSPADVPTALSAHVQSTRERWRALRAAGAIGSIRIFNPASMDLPWSRIASSRKFPAMLLEGAEFDDVAGMQIAGNFNPEYAQLLFENTPHTFAELVALAKDRKPLPHFPLAVRISSKAHTNSHLLNSRNIVAQIPGVDPALRTTYVVLSAHIDHLGIGEPINGDKIYNGAMDNGSGSALLLDVASDLKRSNAKPRRSILFVWVTGEEKGLLGSRYFATHPTVPKQAIVADINTDMFLPIIPLKILRAYGLEESDLGTRLIRVASQLGLKVQADPRPLRNVFIRSDQYNFILKGVPSLMVDVGAEPGSPDDKVLDDWRTMRYHAPSDDTNQPVNLASAGTYESVVERLTLEVANDPHAPQWKPDSFFRRFAQSSP